MTIQDFFNKYNGKKIDLDGAFGAQCADLVEAYNKEVVGAPRIGGNAIEFFGRAPSYHYQKMFNSYWFVPKAGDIVVFGYRPYGDVAICTGQGNIFWFQAFGQNYPIGSASRYRNSSYSNIIGFLRPIKFAAPIVPQPAPAPIPAIQVFWVRVDKDVAMVRTAPNSTAPLGGSQKLYRGNTFQAVSLVEGESVYGNNKWYRSLKGNFIWSGNLTKI